MVAGLAWPIAHGVRQVREDKALRALLLDVQAALQAYHVDEDTGETYIPREAMSGQELLTVLSDFGFLDPLPKNPWTGETWTLLEGEADFLRYESEGQFKTYALRTVDPKTGLVTMELDSETTSLE